MADHRLRTAARALQADTSPEARAAVLRERLRAGAIDPERVALAAYCGDEGARIGLGPKIVKHVRGEVCCCGSESDNAEHGYYGVEGYTHNFVHACDYYNVECECEVTIETEERPREGEWADQADLGVWLRGLSRWGHETHVRASIAAARFWAAWGPEHQSRERDPRIVESLEDLAEWEQVGRLVGDRPFAHPWHTPPAWEPVRQAWLMAHDGGSVERRADPAHAVAAVMAAADSCGEAPVRAAICSALVSWALA